MIVDFEDKYYSTICQWLIGCNVPEDLIEVLNFDTKVLLYHDNNSVQNLNKEDFAIGFWTAGKVRHFYNLYHFYILPDYRRIKNVLSLTDSMVQAARDKDCSILLMHYQTEGEASAFIKSYARLRKLKITETLGFMKDISIFQMEV